MESQAGLESPRSIGNYDFIADKFGYAPSEEQTLGLDSVETQDGNRSVRALAGTGKTTYCEMCMALINDIDPGAQIGYGVFNKKNEVEINQKLPQKGITATAKTMHGFGFSSWRRVANSVKVDARGKWDFLTGRESPIPEVYKSFVEKAVGFAKSAALGVFGDIDDKSEWYGIVEHYDLHSELDGMTNVEAGVEYAIKVLHKSNEIAREVIDFDDMIYCPVLFGTKVWQHDWFFLDEKQDTNSARRALARKLLKPDGRFYGVGDPHQAIYGFTGADNNAFQLCAEEFGCKELPLTVTYRCPKSVVEAAKAYGVPEYSAHIGNIDGEVVFDAEGIDHTLLKPTDAILCRLTRPLVEYAYQLIRNGVGCHVEGRDIGAGLMLMVNKWKVTTTNAFLNKLEEWETKQVERLRAKGDDMKMQGVIDKADTLRIICENCTDLSQVREKINNLFVDTNGDSDRGVTLSTVHKSKGREWPNVYIMGFHQHMPSRFARLDWQREQEQNLIYVAFTRAKEKLVLVG